MPSPLNQLRTCPRCDYDIARLPAAVLRCPECGGPLDADHLDLAAADERESLRGQRSDATPDPRPAAVHGWITFALSAAAFWCALYVDRLNVPSTDPHFTDRFRPRALLGIALFQLALLTTMLIIHKARPPATRSLSIFYLGVIHAIIMACVFTVCALLPSPASSP